MDTAASKDEVRLRKGTSLNERLVLAGFGVLVCALALPGLPDLANGQWPGIGAVAALLFGCLLLGGALLERNVVWIVAPGEILIGEQRPFGRLNKRSIGSGEISAMRLRKDSASPTKFWLVVEIESGDALTSPPLPDVTRVHETTVQVARLLGLPEPEPADNPFDAGNAAIRLGEPVSPKRGRGHQAFVVLLACLLSIPFLHAFWNDKLSVLGVTVWSLGAIVAAVLFRYAPRMGGTFWIVHEGEIRIERLSLKCEIETETIGRDDIKSIDVEDGRSDDGLYVIAIRLRAGRKIRSSTQAGKKQTEALQAEIIRRLGLNPSDAG